MHYEACARVEKLSERIFILFETFLSNFFYFFVIHLTEGSKNIFIIQKIIFFPGNKI